MKVNKTIVLKFRNAHEWSQEDLATATGLSADDSAN